MMVRVIALAAILAAPAVARAADPTTSQVEATPQRPSRGRNAYTTEPGYFELEAGVARHENAFDSPVRIKMGISPRTEIHFGMSPLVGVDRGRHTETGVGDVVFGGKVRFFESVEGDAAIEGFVKLGTADEDDGLGTGETDAGFRFIASRTWGREHFDFNLGGDFAGVPDSSSNDARWTTILTWSRPWNERMGGYGEVYLEFLPAGDVEIITTDWGLTYRINPSFILDAGVNIGLSHDAPEFEFLLGLTKVLGRFRAP